MPAPPMPPYDPPTGPLDIVHADAALLVINKPAGLLSVPGKAAEHSDCLLARVVDAFSEARLVHRLDMDTSGLMVFAQSPSAQRHLGLQFERRHLEKTYTARVAGPVLSETGAVDLPLIADWPNRPLQKVCHATGKPALTRWAVLQRDAGEQRLALYPKTGRSHQLRVHCAALGHPIVGDRFYGGPPAPRLMLHASALRLRHPEGGAWQAFERPAPF